MVEKLGVAAAQLHADVFDVVAERKHALVGNQALVVLYYVLLEPLENLVPITAQRIVFFFECVKLKIWTESLAYLLVHLAVWVALDSLQD